MSQATQATPSTPTSGATPRPGRLRVWASRGAVALGLGWCALHVVGVGLSPGNAGQLPTWATPEQWLGTTAASALRYISLICLLVFLGWWAKRPSQPSNVGKLARVAGAGCAAFLVVHTWHLRAFLGAGSAAARADLTSAASASSADRAYAVSDHLAATLSATYWGIPWLALGYLLGTISVGIFISCELWLASQRAFATVGWRRRRSYAWASCVAGGCTTALLLRALLYFATGIDPLGN